MLRRIVVPLDGSPLAESILLQVDRLAADSATDVVLLTVLDPDRNLAFSNESIVEAEQALSYLEEKAQWLHARGVKAQARLRTGHAATEIVNSALEEAADANAMSTHSRTGLDRLLHGSVTEAVVGASPVPLLLWNPETGAFAAGAGA